MFAPLPPNPCLIAILLVVKSKAGPRFVFHYPPNAGHDPSRANEPSRRPRQDTAEISSSDDEDQIWSSDDDDLSFNGGRWDPMSGNARGSYKRSRYQNEDDDELEDHHTEENERHGQQGERKSPAWESVLGFGTDGLGTLLCPLRTFHKRRFEMTLDQLVFLGWPVFVREDGGWRKRREKRRKKGSLDNSSEDKGEDLPRGGNSEPHANRTDPEVSEELEETSGRETAVEESGSNSIKEEVQTPEEKTPATGKKKDSMTMFHVIFVMSPPPLEYHLRVREMYEHVVKKFSRALKWEQARSDYIWKESKAILKLKEKAKESHTPTTILWPQILSHSPLAKAISTLHTSISTSQIAAIRLTPTTSLSLQIPLPTSTPTPFPALYLTPTTSLPPTDDAPPTTTTTTTTTNNPSRHLALLLLDHDSRLLTDISPSAHDLSAPLTHYIRATHPTKSLSQTALAANIPLPSLHLLASHLIYWRRARAIPPLHQRDTYIVSPLADFRTLRAASRAYAARFAPTLPGLEKMLGMLSGVPRAYGNVIPSKDHKGVYFEILAELVRGGWVVLVRSFACVRVPGGVKVKVAGEMEAGAGEATTTSFEPSLILDPHKSLDLESRYIDYIGTHYLPSLLPSLLLLRHHHHHRHSASHPSLDPGLGPGPDPSLYPTLSPSLTPNHQQQQQQTPITETEISEAWRSWTKYFDGRHALEEIAVREGVKRKRVVELLGVMEGAGVLRVWRGW